MHPITEYPSSEAVASWDEFGLKRTSVIRSLCSSGVLSVCSVSKFQKSTFLLWPQQASSFPSEEKSQQTTLCLVLLQPISPNRKPLEGSAELPPKCSMSSRTLCVSKKEVWWYFEAMRLISRVVRMILMNCWIKKLLYPSIECIIIRKNKRLWLNFLPGHRFAKINSLTRKLKGSW